MEDDDSHVDEDGASSEKFLFDGAGSTSDGAEDAEDDAQGDDDWYGSEAYKLVSRLGRKQCRATGTYPCRCGWCTTSAYRDGGGLPPDHVLVWAFREWKAPCTEEG